MRILSKSHCCSPLEGAAVKIPSWSHPGATSPSLPGDTVFGPSTPCSLHRTELLPALLPDTERQALGVQASPCMYDF